MANLRANKITSTEVFETTGSVQFDGSGDYLSVADNTDLDLGSSNFTIEGFVYVSAESGFQQTFVAKGTGADNQASYHIALTTSENWVYYLSSNGSTWSIASAITIGAAKLNSWQHIALVRSGNTITPYLDGIAGTPTTTSATIFDSNKILSIGADDPGNQLLFGHISNVRVVKGQALYTTNFTPPTRELEVIPNTVLLACQSTTKADEEKTGKTITVNGNAVANELTPGLLTNVVKSGGSSAITGSVEFDGTGDYLSLTDTTDFDLGSGNFTIEGFVHINGTSGSQQTFVAKGTGADNQASYHIALNASGNWVYYLSSNGSTWDIVSSGLVGAYTKDTWQHIALVRNGNTFTPYLNGIAGTPTSSSSTLFDSNKIFSIGADDPGNQLLIGFISNLRVIKGTALYTQNFIPPTRKLTKLPGTVLLCCQDPDNPLTEATGKTITPYGDLGRTPGEYITFNRTFDSNINGWEGYNSTPSYDTGRLKIDASTEYDGAQTQNTVAVQSNRKYILRVTVELGTAGGVRIQPRVSDNSAALATLDVTADGIYEVSFNSNAETGVHIRLITSGGNTGTAFFDDVSITNATEDKAASNFTPQVGDDRKVTFEGVTKINTNAYFYLPTGDTESRDKGAGTRGISFGGSDGSNRLNLIDHINISTTGNAKEFGDLLDKINQQASAASSTRGISAGGLGTSPTSNEIDTVNYITIASTGDAIDFGDLTLARRLLVGCSSQTRGIFAGGYDAPNRYNTMDYVTISSTGNASDFGDMAADGQTPSGRYGSAGYASPTRGVWHGGYGYPAYRNIIDYVTIASTGNTKDFGDSSIADYYMGGCSNSIRGISGGAFNPSPAHLNLIEYTTIATTGNAKDFGDLIQKAASTGACASKIRGVFLGSEVGGAHTNAISYVTLMTMGNALDFGDLTDGIAYNAGCSNGHGGLG